MRTFAWVALAIELWLSQDLVTKDIAYSGFYNKLLLTIRYIPETLFIITFMILLWNVLVLYHVCHMKVDRQLRDISLPRNTQSLWFSSHNLFSSQYIWKICAERHYYITIVRARNCKLSILGVALLASIDIYLRQRIYKYVSSQFPYLRGDLPSLQIFWSALHFSRSPKKSH